MFAKTIPSLRCPRKKCGGDLRQTGHQSTGDIRTGDLECCKCRKRYPILEGVAILVPDPRNYVLTHVKGISQCVPDDQIPPAWRSDYEAARQEIEIEHIEEDLEAERVTSLYVMNHYLRATNPEQWWKTQAGSFSPAIDEWVKKYWDHGPFAEIEKLLQSKFSEKSAQDISRQGFAAVELGCGVGGLYPRVYSSLRTYLGVDSSFASIAIARHLALGCEYRKKLRFPEDLLRGAVSRELELPSPPELALSTECADFVVGDLEAPPVKEGIWDLSIVLNAIDMMEHPAKLPEVQSHLLKPGGSAIQSGPYIWHEAVSRELRAKLPKKYLESDLAVEWLYEQCGFRIVHSLPQVPWLFFKHVRQLELYSVHLFLANKL